ncbi:uncharacterized protein [Amphiura filiformis]|uniref:uncharacterized protein n=1 Tax=Amphiura filiformis TaxID=82378 RepID=UPI003B21A7B0
MERKLIADESEMHNPKYCRINSQDGKGGPIEDKVSQYLTVISERLDKDEDVLYDVKERAKQEGCGIPAAEVDAAKTGEEFLDLLQSYGLISRFHVTYIPWLLRKADGGRDVVKDWKDIEKKIPPPSSLFVSNLPALPKGHFRLEIEVQLPEDRSGHVLHLQKQLYETFPMCTQNSSTQGDVAPDGGPGWRFPIGVRTFLQKENQAWLFSQNIGSLFPIVCFLSLSFSLYLSLFFVLFSLSFFLLLPWERTPEETTSAPTVVFDNLPSELICFLGATEIEEGNDLIILTIQLPSSRRGKKLRNIPKTLYSHLLSVPNWIYKKNVIGVHVGNIDYVTFKEAEEVSEAPANLRQIVWVETDYDGDADWDQENTVGIWHVPKRQKSKGTTDISQTEVTFSIEWVELEYDECDTPPVSSISDWLIIIPTCFTRKIEDVPGESDVNKQAQLRREHYRDEEEGGKESGGEWRETN